MDFFSTLYFDIYFVSQWRNYTEAKRYQTMMAKDVSWDNSEVIWTKCMDQLMTMTFEADFLAYAYVKKKNRHVHDGHCPRFLYHIEDWVSNYSDLTSANETEKGDVSCLVQF